jgi:two-component system, NarL family, sensor histidine kinase DegS
MSTSATLPPFHLDVRVAGSALVGMRFQLDGRAGELEEVIARMEREAEAAAAEHRRLRAELRQVEEHRQSMLDHRVAVRPAALLAAFERSASLYVQLRTADERIAGLTERIQGFRSQILSIRELCQSLGELARQGGIREVSDEPSLRYRQAERQLLSLVEEDHEATAQEVISGPMEQLADVALAVELAGRRVQSAPDEAALDVAHCKEATRFALDEMNRLLFRLSPSGVLEEGLVECVRRFIGERAPGIRTRLQVIGEEQRMSPLDALAAFRVIEEAVDNAARHSHAGAINVVMAFANGRMMLVVKDDGEGFDVTATEARLGRTRTVGMISMRERAEIAGGTCEIRSVLGVGTEVRASFAFNVG